MKAAIRAFEITRTFDAPRAKVWRAWTEAEQLKKWWGPAGFRVDTCTVDLRPGGLFHYGMTAPDGTPMWGKFLYREIDAPRKLVCIVSFSDPQGGTTRHPWSPGWPLHMHSTVLFEEEGGRTKVTIQWLPYEASAEESRTFEEGRDSMKQGWTGTLDQLTRYMEMNR